VGQLAGHVSLHEPLAAVGLYRTHLDAVLASAGLWWLAPFAVIPRVVAMRRQGQPIEQHKNGLAELLLGILFSVILGLAFHIGWAGS
jgi:hypothetical protein